ncbi:MAG: addiction module protein [Planctomycetota bacterium]
MAIDLPLETMSLADKLSTMEQLWADLSRSPGSLPSPEWHRDVLKERKEAVEAGQLQFLDWETAIADLRQELRGDSTS